MKRIVGIALLSFITLQCKTNKQGGNYTTPRGISRNTVTRPVNTQDAVSQIQNIAREGAAGSDCTGENLMQNRNACELLSQLADGNNTGEITGTVDALPKDSDGKDTPSVGETGLNAVQDNLENPEGATPTPTPTGFSMEQEEGIALVSLSGLAILGGSSAAVLAFASKYAKFDAAVKKELKVVTDYAFKIYNVDTLNNITNLGYTSRMRRAVLKSMKATSKGVNPGDLAHTLHVESSKIAQDDLFHFIMTFDAYARLQAVAKEDDNILKGFHEFREAALKTLPKNQKALLKKKPFPTDLKTLASDVDLKPFNTNFSKSANSVLSTKNKILTSLEPHAKKIGGAGVLVALIGVAAASGGGAWLYTSTDKGAHLAGTDPCDNSPTGIPCTLTKLGSLGLIGTGR